MFESLLKVVLSPVDIALSAAKDVVNPLGVDSEKEFGEETGDALRRLGANVEGTFRPEK